jgi:uncharacterized membrane protein
MRLTLHASGEGGFGETIAQEATGGEQTVFLHVFLLAAAGATLYSAARSFLQKFLARSLS